MPCWQGRGCPAVLPHTWVPSTCLPGDVLPLHWCPGQHRPALPPPAGCSPKAREPVPELTAACRSCQDSFPRDHPSWALPFSGKTSCLAAGRELFPLGPCRSVPRTSICQVLGDTGGIGLSLSNAVHPCVSRATLLDIWKGLMMGRTSQGEVLDGQRECDQKMLSGRISRHF